MTSGLRRAALLASVALGGTAVGAGAQVLPSEPIALAGGHVTVAGDVTAAIAPDDTGFFNYTDYEHSALKLFRVDLSTSVALNPHFTLLGEIRDENIELPSIYFAHDREVFERQGMLFANNEYCRPKNGETTFVAKVRYRTVGDASLTAAVRSDADTVEKVIDEVATTRITERGATRGDDKFSEAAMEDRKREGYF